MSCTKEAIILKLESDEIELLQNETPPEPIAPVSEVKEEKPIEVSKEFVKSILEETSEIKNFLTKIKDLQRKGDCCEAASRVRL